MKAMLVEPSRVYHQLLGNMLTDLGFELSIACNAKEAMEAISKAKYDVMCVAMYLDDMDGRELCKKVRATVNGNHVPIIMITSEDSKESLDASMVDGITEIFHKSDLENIANYFRGFIRKYLSCEELEGAVLYVEDSHAIAARVQSVLNGMGLKTDHYTTAEEALEAVDKKKYDLILTDVVLAGQMSGYGLVRAVREKKGYSGSLPILAMTGFDDVSRRIELLRSGVSDYVIKPFIDEELVVRVKNHLMNKRLLDKIEQQQLHMQDIALKDGLTSLYNRHFLTEMAPKKINEAYRHSIPLSLIVVDVDNFKKINDQYGHLKGDDVLSAIAGILLSNCRNEDIAARLGGDEFLLMLSHCDSQGGYEKGKSLCKEINTKLGIDPQVTVSIGVTTLPSNIQCDFNKLFSAADEAVYKAKAEGRNRAQSHMLNNS